MVARRLGIGTLMDTLDTERRAVDTTRIGAWHIGILAALMLVQVVCAALSSTASTDTNRDIYFAQQIASLREFPLVGPHINGMLHLGPVWFYVLAIAAWLIPNAAAVTAFMAAIGALQFPLAYQLGRRFGSSREGLLFALALALPGFMAVSLVSLTHTIAVIPCLLSGIFAALGYRASPDWKHALWLGVLAALALNAHPTTLFLVAALILWCADKAQRPSKWIAHGLVVAAPIVLSFVPMLYAQWQDGFADAAVAARYTHEALHLPSPSKGMSLICAVLSYGPKYMFRFWLDMPPVSARWLLSIYGLILTAGGIGLVWRFARSARSRRQIAVLLGLLVCQAVLVCAIRSDMPPWMIYALWPLIAALLAMGLDQICGAGLWGKVVVAAGLTATTCSSIAVWTHMAAGKIDFLETQPPPGRLPMMADIREYTKDRRSFRMPRIPFRQVFAIGKPLCGPTILFGHYAYLVDITYGIGAIYFCGSRESIQFGGPSNAKSEVLVGLRSEVWESLQMRPARWIGALGVSEPSTVWQSEIPLYPETPHLSTWPHHIVAPTRRFTIEGDAAVDEAVLVAHRANRYLPFSVVGARANGVAIRPGYEDLMTAVYRMPAGSSANRVHWQIEVEGAPEYIDALTFASSD